MKEKKVTITAKGISQFYKDLLHTDNSNTVLTVENSNNSLIQILSPEAKDGAVMFGNPTDGALDGRVVYDNADRALQFWTAGTQRVNIT